MRVLLDETLCPSNTESVGDAIAAASALAEQRGRMIVEVLVDGQHWTAEQLEPGALSSKSAQEIRLTSADPIELVQEVFRDASRALSDADGFQQKAAELLQVGDVPGAMERLQEAISIWLAVQQAFLMGLEFANLEIDDEAFQIEQSAAGDEPSTQVTFKQVIDRLNEQLRHMQSALEGEDTVALADTLLYEMPAVVRQWQDLLDDLEARIAGRSEEA